MLDIEARRADAARAGRRAFGPPAAAAPSKPGDAPIDITCQGSFTFDAERNAASFHDRVDVFRPTSAGESDQLNGELLTAYFTVAADAAKTPSAGTPPAHRPRTTGSGNAASACSKSAATR